MPLILLTNDDGIAAQGLRALEENIQGLATVVVIAPDRERSAVSHGLTIRSPLELTRIVQNRYTLTGTPADCVIYALTRLGLPVPALVVAGINHGANLGDDIMYSGTVAAAREASKHGIPSVALSQAYDDKPIEFGEGGRLARHLIESLLAQPLAPGLCLNVNFPVRAIRGVKVTRQGMAAHFHHFNYLDRNEQGPRTEARGSRAKSQISLDYEAVSGGYVSVTPLHRDQTDYAALRSLTGQVPKLFPRRRFAGLGLIGNKS